MPINDKPADPILFQAETTTTHQIDNSSANLIEDNNVNDYQAQTQSEIHKGEEQITNKSDLATTKVDM